jgi:hypothetical protein
VRDAAESSFAPVRMWRGDRLGAVMHGMWIVTVGEIVREARPLALEKPLIHHRHLAEPAGRELTKAAIEDIVLRGDLDAWRGLVRALQRDTSGRLARRARDVLAGSDRSDMRVHAFSTLLSGAVKKRRIAAAHA